MKTKKIGISLLIALCLLLPTGAVIADRGDRKADISRDDQQDNTRERIEYFVPIGTINQFTHPVIEQVTTTNFMGLFLEECIGDEMYPVPADTVIPLEDCYEVWYKLQTLEVPSTYEPEIEIYKYEADQEWCIYKTSFEDNARNYMEWGQLDLDCTAQGGYYDGWAWSDARACGSDHSFKCTMYDEYKNMQDDILYLKDTIDLTQDEFELCDGTFQEIDSVGTVVVKFDIYVDGERNTNVDPGDYWDYSNPYPLDYLQFGMYDGSLDSVTPDYIDYSWFLPGNLFLVSDRTTLFVDNDGDGPDSCIWWNTNMGTWDLSQAYDYRGFPDNPYCEKIDGCPGWWHVEIDIPAYFIPNMEDFGILFEWRSDKERVYEGAYVDNVEIGIIEDIGTKIYQGHSQDWLVQDEAGTHWFKFPLDWDDDIEVTYNPDANPESDYFGYDLDPTYYKAICKIKTDDGQYMPISEINFEIGDIQACEVEITGVEDDFYHSEVPYGGILDYPSDAHIQFCYTNRGNVPSEDITITASGYKLDKETLLEQDFEGMSNWVYFYNDYPIYVSDKFSWSGSKSLAFNNPDTNMIIPGDGLVKVQYYGYTQTYFSMEDVDEAWMDFYYLGVLPEGATFDFFMLSYHYIIIIDTLIEGPICQKTWVGPMQPQCGYQRIDIKNAFDQMVNGDYMLDENGHPTYDTGIGFRLDTTNVDANVYVPENCFLPGEQPWSGVYIDDLKIQATVKGDLVWSDAMVLPGPCEPGEHCCDQFTWEDVPFCEYIVEVEANCPDTYNQNGDQINMDEWKFIVLENLEQASKVEGVDYSECDPESWCISNVVGNDCGNDGAGDHYALATNCDTNRIPEMVNDWIGLQNIDVSHFTLAEEGSGGGSIELCQPYMYTTSIPISSDFYPYRVYDNFDLGGTYTIEEFSFYGIIAYGDDSPDGLRFNIGFFEDAGGVPGTEILDQYWTCGPGDYTYVEPFGYYSMWEITGTLDTPVDVESGWFSVQSADNVGWEDFAWAHGSGGDGYAYQEYAFPPDETDVAWCIGTADYMINGNKDIVCEYVINEGFEVAFPPAGWTNTGWLWSYYGSPCEGLEHAYSWAAGDTLTSPVFYFGNYSTTLTFQKAAEGSNHPMDLEVYLDGSLIYADYGYSNEDCELVTVALGSDDGTIPHVLEFVGLTSDFYGQILDDIKVEACGETGPTFQPDNLWVNGTYQVDIRSDWIKKFPNGVDLHGHAGVILEVATFEVTDDGACEGCAEDESCPSGVKAWTQLAEFNGNAPGVCQHFNINLVDPNGDGDFRDTVFDVNDTHFCLRFRLETDDFDYPEDSAAGNDWFEIPGIGFHLHEMSISGIIYDEILNTTEDFYEDFEDGNFVNEDTEMNWIIGCVTFGEHVQQCDDFRFCIAEGPCPIVGDYEATEVTLTGYDSYGDGWHGEYPPVYPPERFIDVYQNDVLIFDGFTLDGVYVDSVTFPISQGDKLTLEYYSPTGNIVYIGEESWDLVDNLGTVLLSNSHELGEFEVNIPSEMYIFMNGSFPAEPLDEAILWKTEIKDAFEAYLTGNWAYDLPNGAVLDFEISIDGIRWYTIAHVEGPAFSVPFAIACTPFDLTPWAGNDLLIRVHLVNNGVDTNSDLITDTWYDGYVCVDSIQIRGKQDMFPPTATISLQGNLIGPGLYAGPVTVTINAVDDMMMGEIHYILDGSESVVSGNKATFKVSTDGTHTVEYWAVDATGNEGAHGTVTFSIDSTPPTVAITAPEPGLYLFGNKLLSMSKPIIIGAFTAEATASDAQGVAVVKFMLDGEVVGEDTTVPYSTYVAVKHMGAGTLKVVAEDGVGNTAEDTLDITYYKFL